MAATTSTDLERTRAAFDSWRKSRSARSPIPPPLWEQALALLNSYPLARVARELRISPTRLKKRRQEVGHLPAPAQPPAPSFLTINPVDLNVGDRPSPVSRPVHQATEVGRSPSARTL